MLRLHLLVGVAAALMAGGCATMNVSAHVERGINFAEFATYGWAPADALPTGDPRLDNNAFFRDYLTGAVERELGVRGYRQATDQPQLLVHYHANVSQRFEVHGVDRYPDCYPNCEPQVVEFEQGTIIIDIVNAESGKLLWRGWAQDNLQGIIDNQDLLASQVRRAVTKMFELFPRPATTAAPNGR